MEFIQEGKELMRESHEENEVGERVEIQMNDLQTLAETPVPIDRLAKEHEEESAKSEDGAQRGGHCKPCDVEEPPSEDDEMLKRSPHELDGVHKGIENLAESGDELGECHSHCAAIYRKSLLKMCSATNVAGIQAEMEELDRNGDGPSTPKQDIFAESEVRQVLNYFDKESSSLENECDCSSKEGYLASSPHVIMPCRAFSGEVNINDTQESEASDEVALICPQQEVFEIEPVVSIKDKETKFWKTLSAKPNNKVTDMGLFLDTFDKVMNPNLQGKFADISPKGLNWLTCSSPTDQDKMSDIYSENAQLRRRVQDLGNELCEAIFRQNLAESAYQQTMLQMDDLLNKLDDSSDRISELETCYDMNAEDFDSQLQHTERQVMELRASLQKTEEENGDLDRKLMETQKHVQRLSVQLQIGAKQRQQLIYEVEEEQELSSALQQEIISLQRTLLGSRKTLDFYKHEVSRKEALEEEWKANNSELKRRNEKLEEELTAVQNEVGQSERDQLELQEHLWQTQRVLGEVQLDYKVVSEEKDAINEELKAFYERHNELKMTYRLCVNERNEREQEMAVLVAKVEDSLSEAANSNCFDLDTDSGSGLKILDVKEIEQTPNRCGRTMIEGEDIHPLSESADSIKISLACVRSPYLKDDANTVIYFYNISENILHETSATDPALEMNASDEETLHCLECNDMDTLVYRKEQLQEIESLFSQCEERQRSLENDLANNKVKISSLQDQLSNSHQERLQAYDKVSQLQIKHEELKSAFEKCNREKSNLLKRASMLTRKFRDLQEKYESERTEKCSLQQQLRIEVQKNDGGSSEILRINQQCMEQNLLLDASEFGLNFY